MIYVNLRMQQLYTLDKCGSKTHCLKPCIQHKLSVNQKRKWCKTATLVRILKYTAISVYCSRKKIFFGFVS